MKTFIRWVKVNLYLAAGFLGWGAFVLVLMLGDAFVDMLGARFVPGWGADVKRSVYIVAWMAGSLALFTWMVANDTGRNGIYRHLFGDERKAARKGDLE